MGPRQQSGTAAPAAGPQYVGHPPAAPGQMDQVRVLTLNDGERLDSALFRLQKGWRLRFRLGPSLFGRRVSLYCNLPAAAEEPFERTAYRRLAWRRAPTEDDSAACAELFLARPGSFRYYFTFTDSGEGPPAGSGWLCVAPELRLGPGGSEALPLDAVQCQTVLAKCLGPLPSWERRLRPAREAGYNMVHFTPVQELGISHSAYSLRDQLRINPAFSDGPDRVGYPHLQKVTTRLREEWRMLSVCDIVLNHTANETRWLREHPECAYNLQNCPHLRPAYLLDAALHRLAVEVGEGRWEFSGIPPALSTEEHLAALRSALLGQLIPGLRLWELWLLDAPVLVAQFLEEARRREPMPAPTSPPPGPQEHLSLQPDPQYRRLRATVDMKLALQLFNVYRGDCFDEESRLRRCSEALRERLDELNAAARATVSAHLAAAADNVVAGARYLRVQADGPRLGPVCADSPLVPRYFIDHGSPCTVADYEALAYSPNGCYVMAHNGWVMNDDPLRNFAAPDSDVYLRRELIAWSDSVKLRYGDKPEDCPFLWRHMQEYVEQTARVFDGVRLDNCHSTPIPVAEYMLDAARRVRPDLYVVAELFTNSDQKDNIFVNHLGITSLIREAMSAWDAHELGRLVHRYGGEPVGAFKQPPERPLAPTVAHALFLDLTHDNPSPVEKRCVFDLLPSAALVAAACCATGSSRGYDELVPHHIHVVDESRLYAEWAEEGMPGVGLQTGIVAAKRALNSLHRELAADGYSQVYVDQVDAHIVAVTRHCPRSHDSVVLVAHTAFSTPGSSPAPAAVPPLRLEGVVTAVALEANLRRRGDSPFGAPGPFERDPTFINGLLEYCAEVREDLPLADARLVRAESAPGEPGVTLLQLTDFLPGCVVAVRVSLLAPAAAAVQQLLPLVSALTVAETAGPDSGSEPALTEAVRAVSTLTLADLNHALYRCEQEERERAPGAGGYSVPGHGPLVYCGLQGVMSLLGDIRPTNDLGHALCNNLREGDWLIDYTCRRLRSEPGTAVLGAWLEKQLGAVKQLPRYLVPCYCDAVLTGLHRLLLQRCWNLMAEFVRSGSSFVRALALGSVQCAGVVKSALLPPLSPSLPAPQPPEQGCVSLSAGLPHFSTGYMRNWGRDTFIALRGLFILTGRYQEARWHLLAYAGCLRHGLVPNLLDGGVGARFNCRDAVWWWLNCVQSYVEEAPAGLAILGDPVARLFPSDDSPPQPPGQADQPLREVIQEALAVHFQGLCFRERNSGPAIDAHMTDKGFSVQIGVHPETGFVFGGNEHNCGTWMDKMGSSERAGTRGKPATPRDGSAVELVALCYRAVSWLADLHSQGLFPHAGVTRRNKDGAEFTWTYRQWADRIAASFEHCFHVPAQPMPGEPQPNLVHRRAIYRDSYGASQPWADCQLRCNFPIAMVVAPQLFDSAKAWAALDTAEQLLLGPLGVRTLDPGDWRYRGDYNNDNDSSDPELAHGFNYHNGPEWLWPVGYLLRARLRLARAAGGEPALRRTAARTQALLARHWAALQQSPWRSLPELTNADGKPCPGSCSAQAWSMGCLLEVLHDLSRLEPAAPAPLEAADN